MKRLRCRIERGKIKILNTLSFRAVAFQRPKQKETDYRRGLQAASNILKGFETMIFPERMRGLPLKKPHERNPEKL